VTQRALPRRQFSWDPAPQNSRAAFRVSLAAFRPVLARAAFALLLSLVFLLPAHAQKKQPPAHPLDLNTATVQELKQLPGVGPTTAKSIVLFRTRGGRFKRVEDLLAIRGISNNKLKRIRPYVTVGPAKPAAPPSTPAASKH
jgi:competence ComEA-like helix-hairpin-helix protein